MKKEGREDKLFWTRWFWQDYEADTGLRLCSLTAQGLWMRMLSIMAKSKKKGYLLENEKQMESKSLAKLTGTSIEEIETLIIELEHYGVFSKDSQGMIYNRRMVREAELSKTRAEAGAKGGRPKKKDKKQNESKTKARSASASASASVSASVLVNLIIEYLNEKAERNFKTDAGSFIAGRIAEGYTIDDFKRVIDIKVAKWKDDPKMSDFLRPSTLFRKTNFENYLNEKMLPTKGEMSPEEFERIQEEALSRGGSHPEIPKEREDKQ